MSHATDAAKIVAKGLAQRAPNERETFLRELLAHAAAGLSVIKGSTEAAEGVYRLADALVSRSNRK